MMTNTVATLADTERDVGIGALWVAIQLKELKIPGLG